MVEEVGRQAQLHDFTIGDLAELDREYCFGRSEYGGGYEADSVYLGRQDYYDSIESGPISGQLLHKARESAVRELLLEALDVNGVDGSAQFVEIRSRIVSLMIVEHAIRTRRHEAQSKAGIPLVRKLLLSLVLGIEKLIRAMLGQSSFHQSLFINEDIAAAMRLSKATGPSPV
jgi:hypothetical protein